MNDTFGTDELAEICAIIHDKTGIVISKQWLRVNGAGMDI
jgi:hypothetical protein